MTRVLTLNAGSSSIKFAVFSSGDAPEELASGQIESLYSFGGVLSLKWQGKKTKTELGQADHVEGVRAILDAVAPVLDGQGVAAIGHRVVHGGTVYDAPAVLTDEVMATLEKFVPLAPLHQPHNLAAVRAAMEAFPDAVQVGCFDTAFHRGHPWVNDTFALPRRYYEAGVRRYGFHGLSYDYIAGAMARIDPQGADRTVVCHLGNGASMCALREGQSVASTMGFSALDGLPMGTRCGQLDPGVMLYLMEQEGMDAKAISDLLYKESGLKGLSDLSNDMRVLEGAGTPEADQAIEYFVFRIRRELGSLAAVLGGLDTVVFTGGIGENSANIRGKVCSDMEWIGITLDEAANAEHAAVISSGDVTVRVIPTDEELVIATAAISALEDARAAAAE
ncbi:MAG: acetate/propionate family kinase [Rhodobacteraceae bacterium]|nr:acetate/propionate family kinase [Paracoccaceae bacterium]